MASWISWISAYTVQLIKIIASQTEYQIVKSKNKGTMRRHCVTALKLLLCAALCDSLGKLVFFISIGPGAV